jgi:ATP-dependent RNA helicase DHX33
VEFNCVCIDKKSSISQLIEGAMRELHLLGGIQSTEKPVLTEVGQQMAAFPLDPRFTKLILASKELGCT